MEMKPGWWGVQVASSSQPLLGLSMAHCGGVGWVVVSSCSLSSWPDLKLPFLTQRRDGPEGGGVYFLWLL